MAIALVATLVFVEPSPKPMRRASVLDPLRALQHRGLATMCLTALGYNWGFFTLLAYTPFLMHLGIHQLGYVFTGWGILVATFAVFVAPRAQARFGTPRTLYVALAGLAIDLLVIATFTSSQTILIVAVIVSGAFVGLNNTLATQAVMLVSPVERPVASAAYGFVRFIGGGLAPFCAGVLAVLLNVRAPFYLGAAAVAAAIGVLATGHALLASAEAGSEEVEVPSSYESHEAPIVVAVDGAAHAAQVTDAAASFAQMFNCPVEVVHVIESDIVDEQVLDVETSEAAHSAIAESVERLQDAGVTVRGHLLTVVGFHGDAGRRIADFATRHQARLIVVGAPTNDDLATLFDLNLTREILRHASCDVHVIAFDSARTSERAKQLTH